MFSNTFFQYLPLSPVLCNPSFQKFASFYYQVQNTVLCPWLGLLNVLQFAYIMTGHYSVKCGSFIPLQCHCTSAYSLNTLIHLAHLGNSLQILFGWTEGWCICSSSCVAITVCWLLWYMARWDMRHYVGIVLKNSVMSVENSVFVTRGVLRTEHRFWRCSRIETVGRVERQS